MDRVAYLNMSDPMQSCAPAWRDRSANGIRVYRRQISGCQSIIYCTGNHSVPLLLLEIITIVSFNTMALVTILQSGPVIQSGMVQGVRVKVVAAALLHGSPWI